MDIGVKVTKEAIVFVYWDGPRTQIDVKPDEIEKYPRRRFGRDALARWTPDTSVKAAEVKK